MSSYSFDDNQTLAVVKKIYQKNKYILDPHGAIGYLGLNKYLLTNPKKIGVFLETAGYGIFFQKRLQNSWYLGSILDPKMYDFVDFWSFPRTLFQ